MSDSSDAIAGAELLARALACRANPPSAILPLAVSRLAIGAALLAGTGACTSSPQYPIYVPASGQATAAS